MSRPFTKTRRPTVVKCSSRPFKSEKATPYDSNQRGHQRSPLADDQSTSPPAREDSEATEKDLDRRRINEQPFENWLLKKIETTTNYRNRPRDQSRVPPVVPTTKPPTRQDSRAVVKNGEKTWLNEECFKNWLWKKLEKEKMEKLARDEQKQKMEKMRADLEREKRDAALKEGRTRRVRVKERAEIIESQRKELYRQEINKWMQQSLSRAQAISQDPKPDVTS